ncbi:serine/threonine-protein kinase [Synechocystis sp. LKSZ1]|uniref:serine/threonine protein kinase n=1 Tax=Synechocystis sp. LKSZ1 TaxID=3144951 RepID=UPI00336BDF42
MSSLLASRYEMVAALGAGGFGETFLARDTHLPSQRMVVVKRLKPTQGPNDVVTKLFQKEAAVLEELGANCSQIPQLYSYFMDNGEFFLVQEYIEGKNLAQFGRMGSEQAKLVLSSLLKTLKYIHSQGIIHRDIKPENIILRNHDGLPVLIDFGAVKETMGAISLGSGSIVSSVIVGTRGFMAPEQSAGRPVFSTDLYALGLTMIYALTQKLPIEFGTSQLTGDLDWQEEVPNLDPQLARILEKAIKMEPSRRYPTAEAMYQDLHALLPSVPVVSPSEMATRRVIPDSRPSISAREIEPTRVIPRSGDPTSEKRTGSSVNTGVLSTALAAVLVVLGLGGGLLVMQQMNQSHLQALQAEKEKEEAEKARLEAEKLKLEEERKLVETRNSDISSSNNSSGRSSSESLLSSNSDVARPNPEDFIDNHYSDLNNGDYSTTWARLSSNFSQSLTYDQYIDWWNKVSEVRLGNIIPISQNSERAKLKLNLSYVMNDGRVVKDEKPYVYLVWNDGEQTWLIDKKSSR